MNREEIIKYAREAIEFNKTVRDKNNSVLNATIGLIEKHDGEYERGANEAWALAKKIGAHPITGGYDIHEIEQIFGYYTISDVFNNYHSYQEALEKVKAYEKKKEEEAAKPKLGDAVEVYSSDTNKLYYRGVFLYESNTYYWIMITKEECPQKMNRGTWNLKKTGEHVDIQGMLDKIG